MKKMTYGKNSGNPSALRRYYCFLRKNFWFVFPGSVFRFFVREWKAERLFLSSLSELEKAEIRKSGQRYLTAFSLSFVLHCAVFLIFFYNFKDAAFLLGENRIKTRATVDFDIMDGMVSGDVDPVYDKRSEFVIKPSVLIRRKRKKRSLNALLKELKSSKGLVLSGVGHKKAEKQESRMNREEQKLKIGLGWKKTKKRVAPLRAELWDRMKLLRESRREERVDYKNIMKVIDGHSFQFQECYEKALLKDEKLAGKVIFLLKMSGPRVKKAGLDIQAGGKSSGHREFSRCLFQKSKSLVFPDNTGDISIKFNLIFGL